jgi:structural maintenance of chromosome 2
LQKYDVLSGQLSNLDFQYADPYPKFPRDKVKGLVAKLIRIDPKNLDFTTALQICAEGRLYYVVVEDNTIGSALLKGGKLKRKYTIIPLKQIVATNIDAQVRVFV